MHNIYLHLQITDGIETSANVATISVHIESL